MILIYGGGNGLDDWGNPGDDVAVYSGVESRYTVSFFDNLVMHQRTDINLTDMLK